MRALRLALAFGPLSLLPIVSAACGASSKGYGASPDAGGGGVDASIHDATFEAAPGDAPQFLTDGSASEGTTGAVLTALAITPASNTITAMNGGAVQEQLKATGTYSDGSSADLTNQVVWSGDQPTIGSIGTSGQFTANGRLGGLVDIKATFGTATATATIFVKLQFVENPGNATASVQSALQATTTPDPTVKWAYPYDGTVFPRGLNETTLQWIGGNLQDYYLVHLSSATFDLQSFSQAGNQWFDFTETDWQSFLESTSGAAELKVARWNGTQATTICDLHWTVANGSMRGTIYYSQYQNVGGAEVASVVRIDPGSTGYTDFLDPSFTCPACHTVSAKGNELVMIAQNTPVETSYGIDLLDGGTVFAGLFGDAGTSQWGLAAVSPDGTTVVENFAPLYGNIGVQTGAFDSATGAALPSTGLEGHPLWMPAFSPDGLLLVYVHPTTHDLRAYDWDPVAKQATNDRLLVASAASASYPQIQYPTASPDHQWVVYQRGTALGSQGVPGDLFAASVASPGTEIPLTGVDGTTYPFAAGARDLHLNYEPSFAPVAGGGYFWLVFHSRRTYGTTLTGPAYNSKGNGLKQLWVAAFDQAPASGADPSHPAFYLEGQSNITLNARGYFALAPCKQNGEGCTTGTDCCGGYCDTPDGGAPVCAPTPVGGCSKDGDKCSKSGDCCNAAQGVTCINSVCSEAPPDSGIAN